MTEQEGKERDFAIAWCGAKSAEYNFTPDMLLAFAKEYDETVSKNECLSHVIVFSEKKMWDIDGKLVVGSPVTNEEIEYYNRFFDDMVSEMEADSYHWTHHASKVSN